MVKTDCMIHRLLSLLLCFVPMAIHGQQLLPPIQNYRLLEYKGASKNWDVSVNDKGELFVANNKGLLYFNGEQWTLNKLPNNTIIRSVESIGDRIYTGSYEEFGYWTKNDIGGLVYTSLTHLIRDHTFTSEEFWEILPSKDHKVLFRSFSAIYTYDGQDIQVLDPPFVVSDFIEFEGRLIVASGAQGLFELREGTLAPLPHQEGLKGKSITDMMVYKGQLMVGTKLSGCYLFDGKGLRPWRAEINEELKQHQLNKMLLLGRDQIGFGTIKNGMYLYDGFTRTHQILNRESGLQNNTVLSQLLYRDQLWLGLDNGIARVRLNNPISYYTDHTGNLGMVYDMAYHKGKLYLGSNTGVYYFEGDQLKFVDGSQGHVWDLVEMEGDLLCGHNSGTYMLDEGVFRPLTTTTGGYQTIKVPNRDATYVQGTYNGILRFVKEDGEWLIDKVRGFDFPVKHLCFESPNILWAAHPYKGFYRIHFEGDNYDSIREVQQFKEKGSPSEYNVEVYNIKNHIVLNSEGLWYWYNPIGDRIVEFEEFEDYQGLELLFFDDGQYWFVEGEDQKAIIHTDLKGDSLMVTDLPLRERLVPDSQKMVKVNDSIIFITLSDGFAKIHQSRLKAQMQQLVLPSPELILLRDQRETHPIAGERLKLAYRHSQALTIEVAAPGHFSPQYYFELSGPKEYSEYSEIGFITFQNLPYGDYDFKVSTAGMDHQLSTPNTFGFTISPPWYLSNWSLVLYGVLGILAVWFVRRYNRRKLERKHREMEERMEKQQQQRMAQLEKEELAKEIRLKQNELASTTLNIAKKNEMMLEIKNMLLVNKDKFPNSQRYRSFIKKLDGSIEDNEDWKRFEVNFKELHDDFFERLLKTYPSLTPKDLKLCAYLKMNLSTKEIAPLMAISIRGVEIHRYRLRKKLAVDGSENLSNFLITF